MLKKYSNHVGFGYLFEWKAKCCSCGFKGVSESGELLIGDVFLETTLKNVLENNGEDAISAYDASSLRGIRFRVRRSM